MYLITLIIMIERSKHYTKTLYMYIIYYKYIVENSSKN